MEARKKETNGQPGSSSWANVYNGSICAVEAIKLKSTDVGRDIVLPLPPQKKAFLKP